MNVDETQQKTPPKYPIGKISRLYDDRLEIRFPKRQSTYYSVTEAEIAMYAQLGFFSSFFLTLGGTLSGLTLGCILTFLEGNLPTNSQLVFQLLAWLSGIVSVIFLALAYYMMLQQRKNRKTWQEGCGAVQP